MAHQHKKTYMWVNGEEFTKGKQETAKKRFRDFWGCLFCQNISDLVYMGLSPEISKFRRINCRSKNEKILTTKYNSCHRK